MPRDGGGVYSKPAGSNATPTTIIESGKYNTLINDLESDANVARPVIAGGTGAANATDARANLGLQIGVDVQAEDAFLGTLASQGDVRTTDLADDAVTLAKVADAALSGLDVTLVTGTAGTDGNLSQWNADGDLVDGPDVLDEDDMSSDSPSAIPTQQSVKAYVDASVSGAVWAWLPEQDATSGTSFTFSIPTDAVDIEVLFKAVSLDSGDNILVQASNGGVPYVAGYASGSGTSGSDTGSTEGFHVFRLAAGTISDGRMQITRDPSGDFTASHSVGMRGADANGGGFLTDPGTVDEIVVTRTGSGNFDAGAIVVRYRT